MNNADDKLKIGRDWIAFVVAWIPYSLLTYRFWYNVDDAFISFRLREKLGDGIRPPLQPEASAAGRGIQQLPVGRAVRVCRVLGTRHYFLGTDARFCLWFFALVPCFSNATARLRYGAWCGFLQSRWALVCFHPTLCGRPVVLEPWRSPFPPSRRLTFLFCVRVASRLTAVRLPA